MMVNLWDSFCSVLEYVDESSPSEEKSEEVLVLCWHWEQFQRAVEEETLFGNYHVGSCNLHDKSKTDVVNVGLKDIVDTDKENLRFVELCDSPKKTTC